MNHYLVFVYGVCFALIGGAAFAMMWANIMSINDSDVVPQRHPEEPSEGEEVMYVDVSQMNSNEFSNQKQRLENLYKDN